MDELARQWPGLALQLAAGLAALLLCLSRLRADAFADSPRREVGLQPADVFIGLLIMLIGGQLLLAPAYHLLGVPMPGDEEKATPRQLALIGLVSQLLSMAPVLIYLLIRTYPSDGWRKVGVVPRRSLRETWAGVLGVLVALPMAVGIGAVFIAIGLLFGATPPAIGHDLLRQMLDTQDPPAIGMMVGSAVILAPVFEECLFRGLVQTALQEAAGWQMRWTIVIFSAAIFAAIHIGRVPWQALPSLFVLAIVLGWLYERHGSLLPSILVHMLFNVANIIMAAMMRSEL